MSLHCYLPFFCCFCKIACFEHSEHDSFLTESDCDTEYTDEDVEEHWPNVVKMFFKISIRDNSESIFADNGFVLLVSKFLLFWATFCRISNNALDHLIHFSVRTFIPII